MLFAMTLVVASLAIWVWMLMDVVKRSDEQFPNPSDNTKLIWTLVVVLGGGIGGLVYYLVIFRKLGPAQEPGESTPGVS